MDTASLKENAQSKKYKLACASLLLISCGWVAGNWAPSLSQSFSELISGIMGVLVLYYTGNVGNKFVLGKHMVDAVKAQNPTPNGGTNVTESK